MLFGPSMETLCSLALSTSICTQSLLKLANARGNDGSNSNNKQAFFLIFFSLLFLFLFQMCSALRINMIIRFAIRCDECYHVAIEPKSFNVCSIRAHEQMKRERKSILKIIFLHFITQLKLFFLSLSSAQVFANDCTRR